MSPLRSGPLRQLSLCLCLGGADSFGLVGFPAIFAVFNARGFFNVCMRARFRVLANTRRGFPSLLPTFTVIPLQFKDAFACSQFLYSNSSLADLTGDTMPGSRMPGPRSSRSALVFDACVQSFSGSILILVSSALRLSVHFSVWATGAEAIRWTKDLSSWIARRWGTVKKR